MRRGSARGLFSSCLIGRCSISSIRDVPDEFSFGAVPRIMATWSELNRKIVRCRRCPRLRDYCRQVASDKRRAYRDDDYWGRPVENFGDAAARVLIVGLAPAAHGANRTGRMFTRDRSGEWPYLG